MLFFKEYRVFYTINRSVIPHVIIVRALTEKRAYKKALKLLLKHIKCRRIDVIKLEVL